MIKFIWKISVFVLVVLFLFGLILYSADGKTDPFYLKFTSPKQQSMILGTSRAAQGLNPTVFEEILDMNIYNYAFTLAHSPYGEIYLESIMQKIDTTSHHSIFILCVDPWCVSSLTLDPNNKKDFRENQSCLKNTQRVDADPNFIYLLKNLKGHYYEALINPSKNLLLHKNGWLEVSVNMESSVVEKRRLKKFVQYRKMLQIYKSSQVRLEYLTKTIQYLKNYGDVYLVRLPVHPGMMQIEKEYWPDFNNSIEDLVYLTKGYYDMTVLNDEFQYTDGNHLYKESALIVSSKVAMWINATMN